jgi:acylphosphatase
MLRSSPPEGTVSQLAAKRFYVSGMVQGVGYRFFAQRVAARHGISGYAKNLMDGRVEVYAIGTETQLRALRAELKRGPSSATVEEVAEDAAEVLSEFASNFTVEHEY